MISKNNYPIYNPKLSASFLGLQQILNEGKQLIIMKVLVNLKNRHMFGIIAYH